ncbi:unnamed protein product [Amoebophrya sp. A25]|nr:unnamed protein product [Amoebophrya sp. A25]|eukprot:GSA25T00001643001.1
MKRSREEKKRESTLFSADSTISCQQASASTSKTSTTASTSSTSRPVIHTTTTPGTLTSSSSSSSTTGPRTSRHTEHPILSALTKQQLAVATSIFMPEPVRSLFQKVTKETPEEASQQELQREGEDSNDPSPKSLCVEVGSEVDEASNSNEEGSSNNQRRDIKGTALRRRLGFPVPAAVPPVPAITTSTTAATSKSKDFHSDSEEVGDLYNSLDHQEQQQGEGSSNSRSTNNDKKMAPAEEDRPSTTPLVVESPAAEDESTMIFDADPKKWKNRKIAITVGFCGAKYRGLQCSYLPGVETIENELRKAFVKTRMAGSSSPPEGRGQGEGNDNNHAAAEEAAKKNLDSVRIENLNWSRSSRTDAGVSGRVLVLGCRIRVPVPVDEDAENAEQSSSKLSNTISSSVNSANPPNVQAALNHARKLLNEALPAEIRVFSIIKVPKGFDAQKAASWREYAYVLPRRVVDPTSAIGASTSTASAPTSCSAIASSATTASTSKTTATTPLATTSSSSTSITATATSVCSSFSLEPENAVQQFRRDQTLQLVDVDRLQEALDLFVGVHSFHNFCNLKTRDVENKPGARADREAREAKGKGKKGSAGGGGTTGGTGEQVGEGDEEPSGGGAAWSGKKGKGKKGKKKGKQGKGGGKKDGKDKGASSMSIEEGKEEQEDPNKKDEENGKVSSSTSGETKKRPADEENAGSASTSKRQKLDINDTTTNTKQDKKSSILDVGTQVDWSKLVVRGIDADNLPLQDRFRHRGKDVLKNSISTIYSFRIVDVTDELIEIRVCGQFFIFNQIRLMIGAAVACAMGLYDEELNLGAVAGGVLGDHVQLGDHVDALGKLQGLQGHNVVQMPGEKPGLSVIRAALQSKIECQFPLAPGEGLCLYTSGYTGFDSRTGKMALDLEQYRKCHLEVTPGDGCGLISSCTVNPKFPPKQNLQFFIGNREEQLVRDLEANATWRRKAMKLLEASATSTDPDRDRVFLLLPTFEQELEVETFYREKIRKEILGQVQQVYTEWVLHQGLHRINLTNEGREALLSTASKEPALPEKESKSIWNARKFAFKNFAGSVERYQQCLPNRFTSDLLVTFPDHFLPGPRLVSFQINLTRKLLELYEEGETDEVPWRMERRDLLSFVRKGLIRGNGEEEE